MQPLLGAHRITTQRSVVQWEEVHCHNHVLAQVLRSTLPPLPPTVINQHYLAIAKPRPVRCWLSTDYQGLVTSIKRTEKMVVFLMANRVGACFLVRIPSER